MVLGIYDLFLFMKPLLLLGFLCISLSLFAQSDFVILKKRGITIERYYKGNQMKFYTVEGYLIEGFIRYCKNDSIFLRLGTIGLVPSGFGSKVDTILFGFYQTHIRDITLIPTNNISAATIGNFIFKLGILAGAIVAVNNITIEQNLKNLVQYTSLFAINIVVAQATIFKRKKPTGYKLGKKYQLHYIGISPT